MSDRRICVAASPRYSGTDCWPDLAQAPVQPEHGILQNVVGLFPSPQPRETSKHLSRQPQQPVARMPDEGIPGCFVPSLEAIQQSLELRGVVVGHWRPTCRDRDRETDPHRNTRPIPRLQRHSEDTRLLVKKSGKTGVQQDKNRFFSAVDVLWSPVLRFQCSG